MRKLLHGIVEFRENVLPTYRGKFAELAIGQEPDALFIACSDSRVVPSLVASTDPGQLFVVRNVGNLVPPAHPSGHSTADEAEAAAIEFALAALDVDDIVVCGHSACGAMKALLDGELPEGTPNLAAWLRHAEPALREMKEKGPLDPTLPPEDALSQMSVLLQLDHVRTYPIVAARLAQRRVRLTALWFEIATGIVHAFDEETGRFQGICGEFAKKLIDRFEREPAG